MACWLAILPNWLEDRMEYVGLRVSPGTENYDGADGLRACGRFLPPQ